MIWRSKRRKNCEIIAAQVWHPPPPLWSEFHKAEFLVRSESDGKRRLLNGGTLAETGCWEDSSGAELRDSVGGNVLTRRHSKVRAEH